MDSLSGVLGRTEQLSGELTQNNQSLAGALAVTRTIEVPTSYEDLSNKPKINNVELVGNKTGSQLGLASSSDIPAELKDLSDDSTHRLVTDTEKSTWNGKADTDDIPTKLSDLDDDATHRLVTDTEKSTWNAKANVSDIPDISGKADKSTTLAGYGITNAYTKSETDGIISPITTKLSDFGTVLNYTANKKMLDNGRIVDDTDYIVSDAIEVVGGDTLKIVCGIPSSAICMAVYDSDMSFLSDPTMCDRTLTLPSNTKYIRCTFKKDYSVTDGVFDSNGKCLYSPCRVGAEQNAKITEELSAIAPAYTSKTYSVNELCMYNGKMWKCKASTSTVPTEGTYWTSVTLTALITTLLNA